MATGPVDAAERHRAVVAAISEGIVFFDAEGVMVDCNPAAELLLGVGRAQMLGRRASDPGWVALKEDGTRFEAADYPASVTLATGRPVRGVVIGFVPPGGDVRWVRMNAEPLLREGEARPYGAVTTFTDLTGERHAWVEVRRREAQLRLAMECAGHAYWEVDLTTGAVTGAPWAIAGWDPGAVPQTIEGWRSLLHPDDRARALAAFEAHVRGETPHHRSEYRIRARDGGYRAVLSSARAVARDGAGQAVRIAGTMTDVTGAKELEAHLRNTDRLASLGTLAAGVAHEINNPLAYVTSNLGFVEEQLAALAVRLPAERRAAEELLQAVRDAQDGAARMRGIVKGLRQFVPAGATEGRVASDVRAELLAAVNLARNELTHRAALRVDVPETLPPVPGAGPELGQVFLNLLVNAAQALPEGDAPGNEVRVAARVEGGRLVVEVADTGSGIPADVLPHIFDPFFTTRPIGAGTGLGLSVCHGVVTALGGEIQVDTAPGRGSTFRVLLPLVEAPAAPAPAGAARRGRVLVVDDDALVARSLARLLAAAHDVTTLTSPAEALRRIAGGERWDAVLCDVMMPELSGMELESRLSTLAPEVVPRVVYLTGGAFTDRAREFLESGRPYLEKPVDPAVLRARVAELVARSAQGG